MVRIQDGMPQIYLAQRVKGIWYTWASKYCLFPYLLASVCTIDVLGPCGLVDAH